MVTYQCYSTEMLTVRDRVPRRERRGLGARDRGAGVQVGDAAGMGDRVGGRPGRQLQGTLARLAGGFGGGGAGGPPSVRRGARVNGCRGSRGGAGGRLREVASCHWAR
jgi:hypothetical protein